MKNSRWETYKGAIYPEADELQKSITGELYIDGVQVRFSLKRQEKPRNYLYRGSVRIISPADGKILRASVRGSSRTKEAKESLYTNSTSLPEVKEYILDRAEELTAKYAEAIRRAEDLHITPETITPRQAYGRYAQRFIAETYKGSKPKEKLSTLKSFYAGLPSEPMAKYSGRAIKDYIRSRRFSAAAVAYAKAFWQYCISHQYCSGTNPFPATEHRHKSAEALQTEALKADVLTIQQQDDLISLLEAQAHDDDCGVALMLSGFFTETICSLYWEQIDFAEEQEDFAIVGLFLEERAGATHDYSRPCIPPCARILRQRYNQLRATHSESSLKKAYLFGGAKKRTPSELSRHAASLIQRVTHTHVTASEARMLLHNTYVRNLITRCGLDSDPGTFKFLCGYSLYNDTTSANYTSFTSKEAQDRLYTILRVLQPEKVLPSPHPAAPTSSGSIELSIVPDTTAQIAGVIGDFLLLPGEELIIICPHGVNGIVSSTPNLAPVPSASDNSIPNEFQKYP